MTQSLQKEVVAGEEMNSPPLEHGTLPGWAAVVLTFGSSGAVLLLETLAIRLVAPYIGINLQVSSAVIGIALAAIALGAWTGGRLADRRNPASLIGVLLIGGGVVTLLVLPSVRWLGRALDGPSATAVIILSLAACFLPAFLLSTITPLVVKTQLHDLGRTGRVVGRLSGISTLGAVLATFLTGFVLVAKFTNTAILLSVGLLLVVGGVVTDIAIRRRAVVPVASAVVAVAAFGGTALGPEVCDIETEYNCVRLEQSAQDPDTVVLKLNTSEHSYVNPDRPAELHMGYVQGLAAAADTLHPGEPLDAFHIGGGGMSLPNYLDRDRPGSSQLVYEIDAGLIDVARDELGFREHENLRAVAGDGRTGLQEQADDSYDVVVEDAFGAHSPPWHLTTREVAEEARRVMRPDGYYLVNLIDFPPGDFARAAVATVKEVFPHVSTITFETILKGSTGGNVLVVASERPVPEAEITQRLKHHDSTKMLRVADEDRTARFARDGQVLTDDHAPVDQLISVPMQYW